MGKAQREKGKRGERELAGLWIQLPPGSAVLRDFRRCGCDRAAECTYRSKTSGRPETPESAATVLQGRQGGRDSGGDASQEPGTLEGIHVDGELPQDLFG